VALAGFVLLLVPLAAAAKDVCVHTTADGGWTFVLKKGSLKPGASGAVSGYGISDSGFVSPISGGYLVTPDILGVGVTLYGLSIDVGGAGRSVNAASAFHQLEAFLDGTLDQTGGWFWRRLSNDTITDGNGDAQLVDCATVPAVPSSFPANE
jgi:hypothetical protein